MKILFVCRGNVGRSQMAAALYNQMSRSQAADSAGTKVEHPGQSLAERKKEHPGKSFVIDVMQDAGLDVSHNQSVQLTKDMVVKYDLVISMAGKKYTPKWLADSEKYVYWKVRDPMGRSYVATANARDIIRQKNAAFLEVTNK